MKPSGKGSVFQPLVERGYIFTSEDVYLGKKGSLVSPSEKYVVKWFYTERDGAFVQIKCRVPWSIMFEYFDGTYFINCTQEVTVRSLESLYNALEKLRSEFKFMDRMEEKYYMLESVIFDGVKNLFL